VGDELVAVDNPVKAGSDIVFSYQLKYYVVVRPAMLKKQTKNHVKFMFVDEETCK